MRLSADGTLTSQELGLVLQPAGRLLKVVNLATGNAIPTFDEAADLIDEVLERVEQETQRADEAEARAAVLQAEVERLRRLSNML